MPKGEVHSEIGKAVWIKDPHTGKETFSHIDVKPATQEEIEKWENYTKTKLKELQTEVVGNNANYTAAKPGPIGAGRMNALYASQMITIVEQNLEISRETNDVDNTRVLEIEHAKLLRDLGETRKAAVLYPGNESIKRALIALDKDNGSFCGCTVHTKQVRNRPQNATSIPQVTRKYQRKKVFYPELGGETTCWICRVCNCANVTNTRPPDF